MKEDLCENRREERVATRSHISGRGDRTAVPAHVRRIEYQPNGVTVLAREQPENICYGFCEGNCKRGVQFPRRMIPPKFCLRRGQGAQNSKGQDAVPRHAVGICCFGDNCGYSHAAQTSNANDTRPTGSYAEVGKQYNDDDSIIIAALAHAWIRSDVHEWIVDTGTDNYPISKNRCNDDDELCITKCALRLGTASGAISTGRRADKNIETTAAVVNPLVLHGAVDGLSVVRLVLDQELYFH